MDKSQCQHVYNKLRKAGEKHGIGDFGAYALNSMRLEKGFRGWGAEVRTEHGYNSIYNYTTFFRLNWLHVGQYIMLTLTVCILFPKIRCQLIRIHLKQG